jgi:NodT family efflux transporter outer membrane factor (OMF) lipoprotein
MKKLLYQYFPLAVMLVLLATSCRVGKAYRRPELELPNQLGAVSYADTSSIADVEWKQFFTDTTLQGLIDRGIHYNQDLQIAVKKIDMAQQLVQQAKLLQLPELNLAITGQYNRPSDNSLNGISAKSFLGKSHLEYYSAAVNLSWEADIWGKIRSQKEATMAGYLQSYEGVKAVQTQLVANIAQGYFNLLMLDKQLAIAKKNLVLNDSFLVATQLLRGAGVTNSLAVEQATAQRQATSLLIPQIEQSISIQENALKQLTGQLPGTIKRSSTLDDIQLPEHLNTGLPVAMVSRRPDVRYNELQLVIANAQVGIAQANMYPALNITAGAGLESFKASNWFNIPGSLFGLAAGSIVQPVFRKRALKTEYEVAKIQREQEVVRFRQSVLTAITEVANALVQIDQLKQQDSIALQQVNTLQRAVSNAQLLFKSDLANYLEVITAQSSALQAQLNLSTIKRMQWGAVVELYRSLGGGWK